MFRRAFAFLAALASVATIGLVAAPAASADTIGITTWLQCRKNGGTNMGWVRYTTATNSNGARKIAGVEWKEMSAPIKFISVGVESGSGDDYFSDSSDGGHVAGSRNTSGTLPYLQPTRIVYASFTAASTGCWVADRNY
jgi:hypothetical protein